MNKKIVTLALVGVMTLGGTAFAYAATNNTANSTAAPATAVSKTVSEDQSKENDEQELTAANTKTAITEDQAKQTALASVKDGVFNKIELEDENGVVVYGVEIQAGNNTYDVKVDANTGAIVKSDQDNNENEKGKIEKESKFIPNYPIDINQTLEIIDSSSNEYLNSMDIYQSYHEIAGQKFRLRHGVVDNKHVFYHFALKSGNNGDTRQEIHRNLSKDLYNQLYEINCIKELHKIRSRFIYEFQNKEYILCLDYYDQINKTIVEIEGMGQELAKQVNIKGFSLGSLSTEELVQ